jgi:N-acetyltransferase
MKLDFTKDIILENEVVLLRPLQLDDLDNLLHYSINEPELWQYSLQSAAGKDNLYNYISKAISDRKLKYSYPFIVFDKRSNNYAGTTRFYDFQEQNKSTQLGFTWYGKEFQGTGLNKNCKLLLLELAFEKLQLERVEFRADALNARSIAAMKSIGCVAEGILRSNCEGLLGRRDSIVLSILKKEWFEYSKPILLKKIQSY